MRYRVDAVTTGPDGRPIEMHRTVHERSARMAALMAMERRVDKGAPFVGDAVRVQNVAKGRVSTYLVESEPFTGRRILKMA